METRVFNITKSLHLLGIQPRHEFFGELTLPPIMSSLLPFAVYGLKVPAGDVMVPALIDFPATVSEIFPLRALMKACYRASRNLVSAIDMI